MSQKAPWLVLSAVVLVAAALFAVLAMGSPGGTPGNVAVPGEAQTPLQGETMVADTGGNDTAATGADNSIERQQMEEPPSDVSGQLRVQGRLVFADGRPVEGQDVSMRRIREFRDLDGLSLDELPEFGNENREEVKSDQDGRFSYLVDAGVGGTVRLEEDDWIFSTGTVPFQVSTADVDLGDLEVIAAGLLAGVVLDPAGQPVEGVNVWAGRGLMLGMSREGGRTSVTTDDRGRFRIGGLRPGEYYLRTASSAFLPRDHNVTLAAGERRDDLILSLEQGQAVAGQVVDDMGRPVADINVAARRRSTPSAGVTVQRFTPAEATVTDENGLFLLAGLEGEDTTIRAWGSGYADSTETGVAIGTSNLVLQVQRLAVIAGVLVDETGAPIAGSRVRASASRGGNGFAMEIFETGGRLTNASATTEADGIFRIENVRPGTLTVRATGDSHRPAELPGVVLDAGDVVEGLRLMATRGASVAVEVLDSEGQPVANASVVVVEPPERPRGGPGRGNFTTREVRIEEQSGERIIIDGAGERVLGRGRTDSEGVAIIGGLPSGAALVKAEHTELIAAQPREVNLPLAGTVNAQLTMSPGGFADVTVLDVRGQPISGAQYMVSGPQGPDGSGEEHAGRTDGVGAARVGPLAPGMYTARLQLPAPGRRMGSGMFVSSVSSRTLDESRTEFNVRPGENTPVELTKPVLTAFSGTIYDASGPVSGATVELRLKPEDSGARRGRGPRRMSMGERGGGGGGGSFHGTSGPDGSFVVADLSPGTYTVEYGRPEQIVKAQLEVQFVPGQAEAQQDLRLSGGTVRITVMSQDQGGPLEGARVEVVRPGDEGEEAGGTIMISMTLDGSGRGETTTMEMGGSRVLTDADGVAVIDAVPPGDYSLRITHSTHVEHIVTDQTVGDGQVTDAGVAAMVLGGNVRGQVRRADGAEVMIAMVEYRPAEGDDEDQVPAMRGNFNLEGLKPGKYLVRASDPMGGRSNWGPEEEVEVVAGQTATVNLRLPGRE